MVLAPALDGLDQPIFHPPFSLLDFQGDFAARCYFNRATILAADTGLGKSIITMASACALVEDAKIDLMMIACESTKVGEWEHDISTYTSLRPMVYAGPAKAKPLKRPKPGPPRSREEMRGRLGEVDVLIGTYETFRNDLGVWEDAPGLRRGHKKGRKEGDTPQRLGPGPLLEALAGKRILYVCDEGPAKMGATRTSHIYKANELLLDNPATDVKTVIVSATPMDRDPEGFFNVCRLIIDMPNVTRFNADYVAGYDLYKRPSVFKNLHPGLTEPGKVAFRDLIGDLLLVKSKNDPDVVDRFPTTVQDYTYVRLSEAERAFYNWIIETYGGEGDDGSGEGGVYTPLRQFCGHPLALLHAKGGVAVDIARNVGEASLASLGASKAEALVSRLKSVCGAQQEQAVVFTFFGQSVLPVLAEEIRKAKISVVVHHGGQSAKEKADAQAIFKAGHAQVLLSSDAGSRGINLPQAAYVEEYDFPLKFSTHEQRINRVSRLNSAKAIVFTNAWAVAGTLEEDIIAKMLKRKGWAEEVIVKDEITAAMMRQMLKQRRSGA